MVVNPGASRYEPQPRGFALLLLLQGGLEAVLATVNVLLSVVLLGERSLPTGQYVRLFGVLTLLQCIGAVLGGHLADRVMSPRKVMLVGGALATLGVLAMCVGQEEAIIFGMAICGAGGALIKPCLLVLLGSLYRQGDARRDSGFTWMFTVSLGAWALGASLSGAVNAMVGSRIVFVLAALGMLAFTTVATLSQPSLPAEGYVAGAAGVPRARLTSREGRQVAVVALGLAVLVVVVVTGLGILGTNPTHVSHAWGAGVVLVVAVLVFYGEYVRCVVGGKGEGASGPVTWQRLSVLLVLAPIVAVSVGGDLALDVWGAYAALDQADLSIGRGTVTAISVAVGVMLALVWRRVDAAERRPSGLVKLALGAFVAMAGAGVMVGLSVGVEALGVVLASNLLLDCSRMVVMPVGQAMVTKLAPTRSMTTLMAVWTSLPLLASAFTGLVLDLVGGTSAPTPWKVALVTAVMALSGALLLALRPTLKRWMHGAEEPPAPQGTGYLYRGDGAPGGEEGAAARWDAPQEAAQVEQVTPTAAEAHVRKMLLGAALGLGGLAVTLVSLQSAEEGGRYVVAYGAIVYGLITFIRGLAGWSKERP